MRIIDDLPIYFIVVGVLINFALGISLKTNFTVLMIRSIIVTVVFAIFGLVLSKSLKDAAETVKRNKKAEQQNKGTNFDVAIPPDDEDLMDYGSEEEEEFKEINPAYLHKINNNE